MNCPILWPSNPDHFLFLWGALAGKLGCAYPLERPFLIGARGVLPGATETHPTRSRAAYDDSFVLMAPSKRPVLFAGSTHAYQLHSKLAQDANRDGVGDVGTIDPGRYVLTWKMRDGAGCPVFELTMPDGGKNIPCHRDIDHNGTAEAGGYTANAILFHTGFDAPPGADHASSIGCQTTSKKNLLLLEEAGHVLDYVLADASTLVTLAGELPAWDDETEPQA
jgi:hypothetical protein